MALLPESFNPALTAFLTQPPSQVDLAKKIAQESAAKAAAAHKAALARAENAGQGYNQLATAGEGVPAQITEMFDAAAGKSEAFAQGFSQAFQSETEKLQQQQQELLRKQTGDPNAAVPGNKLLGDASMFLGGLPASVYRTQGAGLSAAAALQPDLIRSQGLQAVQTAKQAETDAYAKLLSDLQGKANTSLLSAQKTDVANAFAREKADTANAFKRDAAKLAADKFEFAKLSKEAADARAETYLAIAGDKNLLSKITHLEKTDGWARTVDEKGNIVQYLDADGKGVRTQSWLDKQRSLSQRDRSLNQGDERIRQADERIRIAEQNVQLANQRLMLSGDNANRAAVQFIAGQMSKGTDENGDKTIYTIQRTKDGWAVAQAVNPRTGKPLTAKQQGFTPTQTRKLKIDAGIVAKNSKNGITSAPGKPEFFDESGNVVAEKPNDPSKGWSQLVPGSNPPAYINHHPALSYDEAAQKMIVDGQYPPSLAYEALNRFYKPGENGRPGQSPGQRKVASGYSLGETGKAPPNVKVAPGVSLGIVDNRLLDALGKLQADLGVDVQIISGYRTQQQQEDAYRRYVESGFDPAYIAAKPGLSNHQRGQAVDVLVNGRGIGDVIDQSTLAKYGIHNPVPGDGPHTTLLDVNG